MAQDSKNNDTSTKSTVASRVETEIQNDMVTSTDVGVRSVADGGDTRTVNADAASFEFGKENAEEGKEALEKDPQDGVDGEGGEQEDGPEAGAEEGDLGEWKRDDPEVQAKFEAKYFTENGQLNKDALSKEFWASHAKDPAKAGLNDATYEFLKDTLGVNKEMVKEIEGALVTKATALAETFFKSIGGRERYDAMVKWGREGGYTPAQRDRFNKAMNAGGVEFEEAVEALANRFNRAHPQNRQQDGRRGPPQRRQSAPARNVTGGAAEGASGTQDSFKSAEEYREAWQAGLAALKAAESGQPKREARAKLEELRKKARRGRFV